MPRRARAAARIDGVRTPLAALVATSSLALGALGLAGCGGGEDGPGGIVDPAAGPAVAERAPAWFPAQYPPPSGGVIVEVIEDPQTDNDEIEFGRSVTWRVDRSYEEVLRETDAVLASLQWTPTSRDATEGDADSERTAIYIENDTVWVIQVYTDANLAGTRVTVELTP